MSELDELTTTVREEISERRKKEAIRNKAKQTEILLENSSPKQQSQTQKLKDQEEQAQKILNSMIHSRKERQGTDRIRFDSDYHNDEVNTVLEEMMTLRHKRDDYIKKFGVS